MDANYNKNVIIIHNISNKSVRSVPVERLIQNLMQPDGSADWTGIGTAEG